MEGDSTARVIGEMQIKTIRRHHYMPMRRAKIQNPAPRNAGRDAELIAGGDAKRCGHLVDRQLVSYKTRRMLTMRAISSSVFTEGAKLTSTPKPLARQEAAEGPGLEQVPPENPPPLS